MCGYFLKMHGAILLVIESAPLSEDEDERNWLQPDVKVADLCMLWRMFLFAARF